MTDWSSMGAAFVEGVLKVLPALLAAFYAYRLWHFKMAQDRADSIAKGCLILRQFCRSLDRHLSDDPSGPTAVAIDSINSHMDTILSTKTGADVLDYVLTTYYLWRRGAYFPASIGNEEEAKRRRTKLGEYASACEVIARLLRSATPRELARMRFSSL